MKILLIGASGCFGTELISVSKNSKYKINLIYYSSRVLNIVDSKNLEKKIKDIKPDIIINSSAMVGINQCEKEYDKAFLLNSIGTLNLAKICKKFNIIIVQISTHAVFNGKKKSYYVESDIPKPNNVYAGTKYLSEKFVSSICDLHYIIRFPTLYGNRNNQLLGFVDKVINLLKSNDKLRIAVDKIDSPTYAKDAAAQLLEILFKKKSYGTYHIANKGKVSLYRFVLNLKNLLNSKSKIFPVKDSFFLSDGYKPLRTALKSSKIINMRHWKNALEEYVHNVHESKFKN